MKVVAWLVSIGLSIVATGAAQSQPYPSKPVRLIVPYPAAGGYDLIARIIGARLSATWGQQVVVDNRSGAEGNIGTEAAAKATPDGYTISMGGLPTLMESGVPFEATIWYAVFAPAAVPKA